MSRCYVGKPKYTQIKKYFETFKSQNLDSLEVESKKFLQLRKLHYRKKVEN